jgi:alkylated DNA repair protein (DNA oxidative demethylase)
MEDSAGRRRRCATCVTPGGFTMSVALTNCGALGWTSDRRGYRYSATDPAQRPALAAHARVVRRLALRGRLGRRLRRLRAPDACLVNRYAPGARLSLHQDKDEHDYGAPIVSVSLGMPAVFLFGGLARADKPARVPLAHGDVVVWGGPSRLAYHGVAPLARYLRSFMARSPSTTWQW